MPAWLPVTDATFTTHGATTLEVTGPVGGSVSDQVEMRFAGDDASILTGSITTVGTPSGGNVLYTILISSTPLSGTNVLSFDVPKLPVTTLAPAQLAKDLPRNALVPVIPDVNDALLPEQPAIPS